MRNHGMLHYDDHPPRPTPALAQPPLSANRDVAAAASTPTAGTADLQTYWKDLAAKGRDALVVRQAGTGASSAMLHAPNESDATAASGANSWWTAQAGTAAAAAKQQTASADPAATPSASRMKP